MSNQRGFALLFTIIVILSISSVMIAGLSILTIRNFADVQNKIKSTQSYYAAEAGLEDYLYRLRQGMKTPESNSLTIGNSVSTIQLSDSIGEARIITVAGNTDNRIRKVSVTYAVSADKVSFYYGVQAGKGGIQMDNNSQIIGNVFSNGAIIGSGKVTETVIVSGNDNTINGIEVGKDAYAYSCINSNITNTLYYVTGGTVKNCNYGSLEILSSEIENGSMPIPEQQIVDWENTATVGGTIAGNYTINSGALISLGPTKITGNLIINNNAVLNLTGIVYVEGDITVSNLAVIQLDSSFGSTSGIIIANGKIIISNGVTIQGSGKEGSYTMMLSINNSLDPFNPAIDVKNNTQAVIFYTTNGIINLRNNVSAREVTGYKILLNNNAIITYESGLADLRFTSGTGGSWQVVNWQEVE